MHLTQRTSKIYRNTSTNGTRAKCRKKQKVKTEKIIFSRAKRLTLQNSRKIKQHRNSNKVNFK